MTAQQPDQITAPAEQSDAEKDLHEDIARTRAELGQTVEQLAAKADVKSRAQDAVRDLSGQVRLKARQARDQLSERLPEPVSNLTQTAVGSARRYRLQLTAAAAVVAAILAARKMAGRRSRGNRRR
jgi:hypothetical protein